MLKSVGLNKQVLPLYLSLPALVLGIAFSVLVFYKQPALLILIFMPVPLYFIIKRPVNGIYLLVIISSIVPPAPQKIGPMELLYMCIFAFTIFLWAVQFNKTKYPKTRLICPILFLYILIFISFFIRYMYDITIHYWIRGVIPFLNLIIFFVLLSEIKDIRDVDRIIWALRLSAILVIGSILVSVFPVLGSAISKMNFIAIRASLEAGSFGPLTIMLPAFFFALWTNPAYRSKLDFIIILIFLLIVTLTFLRSAILTLGFIAILVLYRSYKRLRFTMLIKIFLPIVFAGIVIFSSYHLSGNVRSFLDLIYTGFSARFTLLKTRGDVRTLEIKEVFRHSKEAPILGHGLGFQYSYNRRDFMSGKQSYPWSGGYTHNIFTYFLLVFGIFGVINLLWIIYTTWKEYKDAIEHVSENKNKEFLFAVLMGLLSMFIYANFQSIFRSVNYSLILSILFAILVKFHRLPSIKKTGGVLLNQGI